MVRGIRSPLLQIFRRGQKALVLHGLPFHYIVVGENGHAPRCQHLITTGVIEMVMTVDGKLDRKFCQRLNFANKFFESFGSKERVENQHAFIANDKARVA